ncbi:MAG: hypothetical protein WKG07_02480 [Hymenobacter sp.]
MRPSGTPRAAPSAGALVEDPRGDYATGHDEVRNFWQWQWQDFDTSDEPTSIRERADGRLEVAVHQLVQDKHGRVVADGSIKHLYTPQEGLLKQMDIEKAG